MTSRTAPALALTLLPLLAAGCAETTATGPARAAGDFATRRIADASLSDVRPEAERVFRQYFRVDPAASTAVSIVSYPEELEGRGEGRSVRDALTISPSRQRRIAELRLRQDGQGVVALCRIQTQRLDTVERAAFAGTRGDDRPSERPIDRTGNTTTPRREEWVNLGRDRKTEAAILDAIQRPFTATQPAAPQ